MEFNQQQEDPAFSNWMSESLLPPIPFVKPVAENLLPDLMTTIDFDPVSKKNMEFPAQMGYQSYASVPYSLEGNLPATMPMSSVFLQEVPTKMLPFEKNSSPEQYSPVMQSTTSIISAVPQQVISELSAPVPVISEKPKKAKQPPAKKRKVSTNRKAPKPKLPAKTSSALYRQRKKQLIDDLESKVTQLEAQRTSLAQQDSIINQELNKMETRNKVLQQSAVVGARPSNLQHNPSPVVGVPQMQMQPLPVMPSMTPLSVVQQPIVQLNSDQRQILHQLREIMPLPEVEEALQSLIEKWCFASVGPKETLGFANLEKSLAVDMVGRIAVPLQTAVSTSTEDFRKIINSFIELVGASPEQRQQIQQVGETLQLESVELVKKRKEVQEIFEEMLLTPVGENWTSKFSQLTERGQCVEELKNIREKEKLIVSQSIQKLFTFLDTMQKASFILKMSVKEQSAHHLQNLYQDIFKAPTMM